MNLLELPQELFDHTLFWSWWSAAATLERVSKKSQALVKASAIWSYWVEYLWGITKSKEESRDYFQHRWGAEGGLYDGRIRACPLLRSDWDTHLDFKEEASSSTPDHLSPNRVSMAQMGGRSIFEQRVAKRSKDPVSWKPLFQFLDAQEVPSEQMQSEAWQLMSKTDQSIQPDIQPDIKTAMQQGGAALFSCQDKKYLALPYVSHAAIWTYPTAESPTPKEVARWNVDEAGNQVELLQVVRFPKEEGVSIFAFGKDDQQDWGLVEFKFPSQVTNIYPLSGMKPEHRPQSLALCKLQGRLSALMLVKKNEAYDPSVCGLYDCKQAKWRWHCKGIHQELNALLMFILKSEVPAIAYSALPLMSPDSQFPCPKIRFYKIWEGQSELISEDDLPITFSVDENELEKNKVLKQKESKCSLI